jgi:glucosylceramidase
MAIESTRRDFLKISTAGLAAGAVAEALPAWSPLHAANHGSGEITVRVTDKKRRFENTSAIEWRQASRQPSAEIIELDPGKKFQEILGFGAAFTDAACYMFNQLSADSRQALFHELFHPSELGLNVCRTCIGASDYSTELYSFDEGAPDPELKRFSIDHDRAYLVPSLQQARRINPDLFLFSSPWSPPGWMKPNASMLGGSMRKKYYASYAQYFLKFLQAYAAEGVPIQAVTSQNEVDTDQDGRMPACLWGQEYEIEFVKLHLGPTLKANGIPTKIWLLDHNYNLWGRAICELDDPDVRQHANAVAWHGYAGDVSMISKVHDAHPDVAMHWTEGGADYTSPDYLTDWAKWGRTFAGALRNWCQSITGWNLALDEQGRPNIGPFPCGGLVTIHSQTKEVTRSGQYWAFAHFSRLIRRGAHRFDSQGTLANVDHVACENPDGERVLVIANSAAAERSVVLQMGAMTAQLTLSSDSLSTLTWK